MTGTTGTVTVTREEEITVSPGTSMMVSTGDWARIRRSVERVGEPILDRASSLGAVFVGAAIALLSITVSIKAGTTTPAPGLVPALWVGFGLCALFAIILLVIGSTEKRRYRVSNRAVCDDMDDVAEKAGHPSLGVLPPKLAIGIKGHVARLWRGDAL